MIDVLMAIGALSILLSSIGLLRMPDTLSKLHAATKASAFGIVMLALATVLSMPGWDVLFLCLAIVIMLYITAPLACHSISARLVKRQQDEELDK